MGTERSSGDSNVYTVTLESHKQQAALPPLADFPVFPARPFFPAPLRAGPPRQSCFQLSSPRLAVYSANQSNASVPQNRLLSPNESNGVSTPVIISAVSSPETKTSFIRSNGDCL